MQTPAGPYMPSLTNTKVHLLKGCTQFKSHSLHMTSSPLPLLPHVHRTRICISLGLTDIFPFLSFFLAHVEKSNPMINKNKQKGNDERRSAPSIGKILPNILFIKNRWAWI